MNVLEKTVLVSQLFYYSAKSQLVNQEYTVIVGGLVGLNQGLKYNGSFKRGLVSGVATIGVICAITGVINVMENWDRIREL